MLSLSLISASIPFASLFLWSLFKYIISCGVPILLGSSHFAGFFSNFPTVLVLFFVSKFGAMRFAELMFLLCLLFLASVGSNTVAKRTFLLSNLFDAAKKSTNEMAGDDARKCRFKSFRFGHYLSCSDNKITSDDKRVVPTGPNPLHNR